MAGHVAALKAIHPGIAEREIQALMQYEYQRRGCERSAYAPIVGSGFNSTVLHYSADSAMMRGLASKNIDSLMRYYDPDVVSMTQGSKPVKGMGSVRSSYAEVLTANPGDLSFDTGGISFSNDGSIAWHYGTFEATATDAAGKPVKAAGNYLQIWKHTGARWVIVAEINNSFPPRQ